MTYSRRFKEIAMADNRLSKENILPITQRFLTLAANLKEEQAAEHVKPALEQYRLGLFRLVVVGEIKKGKSSFINALLGEPDLLPTMSDVATSTVYKILYGKEKKYKVFFLPQDAENPEASTPPPLEITPEQVAEYGTENGNPENKKKVDFIGVQLPHPLLKTGVVIIDTPGLGGVFREHQYITWRYIPNADAIFFVMDSVEAVASQAEMEYLHKLRSMTQLLFFVQTKIDLPGTEQWQQWRDRNLDIIADTLQVPKDKLIYFPVSAQLKRYADEDKSPGDLNKSGFVPVLHFLYERLLKTNIGIYTTFMYSKNNGLQERRAPSPAGEGWGEENKINWLYSPSSRPSPSREKGRPLV
jgi:GTPase SAR1 family protein